MAKTVKSPSKIGTKTLAAREWLGKLADQVCENGIARFVPNKRLKTEDLESFTKHHGFLLGGTNSGQTLVILNRLTNAQVLAAQQIEVARTAEIARKARVSLHLAEVLERVQKMGAFQFVPCEDIHPVDLINWTHEHGLGMCQTGDQVLIVLPREQAA